MDKHASAAQGSATLDPEVIALLKILGLGEHQIDAGKVEPAAEVFKRLRGGKQS